MGLFGDADAAEVSDDPFFVPAGTYECVVTEAKIVQPKDESKRPGLAIKYNITDEGDAYGLNAQTWKTVYSGVTADEIESDPDIKKGMSFLKMHLLELGVAEEDMNNFDNNLDDLIGNEYVITVKETVDDITGRKYSNVNKIVQLS